jgi:5-(carboxyamino)imidazole ribonucleotide synthase
MAAIAAKRMGYRVIVLDPTPDCPAGQVADEEIIAPYSDVEAAKVLAQRCAVVTAEFENVPAATLEAIEQFVPVRPSSGVLRIAQNRIAEKTFLARHGFPVPQFRPVRNAEELRQAVDAIGCPAVLKTAVGGYDGKGQVRLDHPDAAEKAWQALGCGDCVLEEFVPLEREVSVIVARNLNGDESVYPVAENTHANHILDTSVMPARIPAALAKQAQELALAIAQVLGVVGLLCVEMFVAMDGRLLVNELAPRPHNSGHQTFDAAVTSQFEQLVRAICNLPLGSTELYRPAAIANLLGDLWQNSQPNWVAVLELADVKLHLYGKAEARPGRKMGHLTATGATPDEALQKVLTARRRLTQRAM